VLKVEYSLVSTSSTTHKMADRDEKEYQRELKREEKKEEKQKIKKNKFNNQKEVKEE